MTENRPTAQFQRHSSAKRDLETILPSAGTDGANIRKPLSCNDEIDDVEALLQLLRKGDLKARQ